IVVFSVQPWTRTTPWPSAGPNTSPCSRVPSAERNSTGRPRGSCSRSARLGSRATRRMCKSWAAAAAPAPAIAAASHPRLIDLYGCAMRIGVLIGGGDCPGLNAVIRAVVRKAIDAYEDEVVGFRDGWRGVLENAFEPLTIESTRGILPRGGTILGSSRTNPYKREDGVERARETFAEHRLDGLIAIGGEDTLGVANRLHGDGVNVIGVPKTIDNDLAATDVTFGFDTALQIATEAVDRLHTTAESDHRILVVEVMGRSAGWIALHAGIAGGADVILIPEQPFDIDEVCRLIG